MSAGTAGAGPLVIGVDSSTQSTKALVVDSATGEVLARGQAPHTVSEGAWRESDPEQWWQALCEALRQTGLAERAAAISVGGQQHGLVTLDAAGRPVRPALLWNDVRSAEQTARLTEALGGPKVWAERFGGPPAVSFTAGKWLWVRENEPDAAKATAAVRLPHDYLTERLSGRAVTDRGDASGTAWWSTADEAYDAEVLDFVGLEPAMLPEVLPPGEPAGTVKASAGLPLPKTALVASGTGDNMGAAVGLGLVPGQPAMSLGTSGTVYAVSTARSTDPSGTVAGFADTRGDWLPLACTLNCTQAVDKVAALLGRDRQDVESGGTTVLLPFLDGERTPNFPYATGLLYGIRHDTTPGQILQAAYDGAAYALLAALDRVLATGSAEAGGEEPILLIGGGARGVAWRETVRRLSGRAVQVPAAEELVALGAAAQAAGLLTGEDPAAVARRWGTTNGPVLGPVARDEEALARLRNTLSRASDLLGSR